MTDSLSLSADTRHPLLYTTKIFPVPHLHGVIVGTGAGGFGLDWFRVVNTQMVVRNIPHLDHFAPNALRALWAEMPAEMRAGSTATIYHFGFDDQETRYRGFAYRSERDFESEELQYGIGIKPPTEVGEIRDLPGDLVRVVERQRAEDRAKPRAEQVGIGGDVFFLHLTPDGMTLRRCHRFDDYEEAFVEMCKNVRP
jgi:hypothetical protein